MKKFIAFILLIAMAVCVLASCGGGGSDSPKAGGVIRVWVGEESVEFYQKVCNEYAANNSDFGFTVEVKGMDTGTVAQVITNDPIAAADIYTVAHDNIGKLAATQCAKPIGDQSLIDQVVSENPESFRKVIYSTLNEKEPLRRSVYFSGALPLLQQSARDRGTGSQLRRPQGSRQAGGHQGDHRYRRRRIQYVVRAARHQSFRPRHHR